MNTVEIFSGTKSFSKVMEEYGFLTETVDNNIDLKPGIVADIRKIPDDYFPNTEILWASPPCQGFSVAAIGKNWGGGHRGYEPKSDSAKLSIELVKKTLSIIQTSKPKWWFIENPRGLLRKMPFMQGFTRHTVTYCQYGDNRMKPTDLWTNAHWFVPRPVCKNGDTCHEASPRGSKTGTQGIKGAKDRGRIPPELFQDIIKQYGKSLELDSKCCKTSNEAQPV